MKLNPQEISVVVQGIRNGDKTSLEILFRLLYTHLRNYANTLINSGEDAEDIVQEIFLKLWKNRADLDENKSIQTYLFVSTRNSCFNWLKHQKIQNEYARVMAVVYEEGEFSGPHEWMIAEEIEKDFYSVLDDLPPQCRKIFELNRLEGLRYQEIATRLNISIKTVETQMSRALLKVKLRLKRHIATIHFLLLLLLY